MIPMFFNLFKTKIVLILSSTWERVGEFKMKKVPSKDELFYYAPFNTYYSIVNVIHWPNNTGEEMAFLIVEPLGIDKADLQYLRKEKKS
jgi:hypothetical protein